MSTYSPRCILLTNFAGKAGSPSPVMKGGLDSCDLASSKLGSADLGSSCVAPLVATFLPTVVPACLAPTSWAGVGFSFPIVARPNSSMVEALACHRDHWFLPNLGKGGSCNITPQINPSETQAAVVRSPIFFSLFVFLFVFCHVGHFLLPCGPLLSRHAGNFLPPCGPTFSFSRHVANCLPPCRSSSPPMRISSFSRPAGSFLPPCAG